jgi:hypothetical protein
MMEASRRNHPTIDDMRLLPIGQVIDLPAEHLALLQEEARSRLDIAKRALDWIEGAIALRYEQRAIGARATAGKDTGTVRFQDGAVEIAVDLPKKVEWDQTRLAALAEQIRAGGEDPGQYVEVSFKVSERAYTAWPERIRQAFEPARTVRTGRATYRLAIMSDVARRDSPHADGVIPMRGGR